MLNESTSTGAGPPNKPVRAGRNAIVATPGALLAGPGSTGGGYSSFSVPFAASESAKFGSKLTLLTQHFYVAGAGSTAATASSLQTVSSTFMSLVTTMNGAATKNKVPNGYRLGEINTFSGHGQQGVSDTLIAGPLGDRHHVRDCRKWRRRRQFPRRRDRNGWNEAFLLRADPGEQRRRGAGSPRILRHAPLHPSRPRFDGFHDRQHDQPQFHRVCHQGQWIYKRGAR